MQFLSEGLMVEGLELTTVDTLGMSRYTLFSEAMYLEAARRKTRVKHIVL
jgi:hypothetical protein